MKMIKKDWFIALNITLLILLVFAWNQRWVHGPKDGAFLYEKDNWTDQRWVKIYGGDESGDEIFIPTNEKHLIHPWTLRNLLNWGWILITLTSLFFTVYGFLSKLPRKENHEEKYENNH